MALLIVALRGAQTLAIGLARLLKGDCSALAVHAFPDGETLVRIDAGALDRQLDGVAGPVVSCDTVPHAPNPITLTPHLARALLEITRPSALPPVPFPVGPGAANVLQP